MQNSSSSSSALQKPRFKFPRAIEADSRRNTLEELLSKDLRPLWENGRILVPHLSFTENFERELINAKDHRHLERGLERIEHVLNHEKAGQEAVARKKGTPVAERISRLLIIADDGVERFNRGCESILVRHSERVLGLRLNVSSEALSAPLFGPEKSVKAVLVTDREDVTALLISLFPS
jgi:hypothetical protein